MGKDHVGIVGIVLMFSLNHMNLDLLDHLFSKKGKFGNWR